MNRLIHFRLCPRSRFVRLALSELRIEVKLEEERPWDYRRELLEINPAGELPILCLDGVAPLCGSYAISEYLSESPERASPALLPAGREQRAEVRRLIDWFNGKMLREVTQPLIEEKVVSRFRAEGPRQPDAENLRAGRANLRYHLGYIDFLAHDRSWLAGPEMSFADLAAAAHLSCLDYLGEIGWDEVASARQWYARMKSRPSLRAQLAERVAGAPMPPAYYPDPDF